jgi:hypothetical protein
MLTKLRPGALGAADIPANVAVSTVSNSPLSGWGDGKGGGSGGKRERAGGRVDSRDLRDQVRLNLNRTSP